MKLSVLNHLVKRFEEFGQGHVFKFFDDLPDDLKEEFITRAQLVDLDHMKSLINQAMLKGEKKGNFGNWMPVESFPFLGKGKKTDYLEFIEKGEKVLRAGRVAVLVVAGGQGTRLGFDGPKGVFPITPIKKKSLFQVFAEKIKVAQERYKCVIPWYIMTSISNYNATLAFFDQESRFGLEEVYFFKQGMVPIVDFNGKFLLDKRGLIAMSPDGHGGCFDSLVRSGLVSKMEKSGIDVVSYFQVDNPLVKCIDPLFIGLHTSAGSEMSSKVVRKQDPTERVGIFCQEGDHLRVLEYSDAPQEILTRRKANGELAFNAGNIAAHLLDREFIKRMGEENGLVFHVTKKVEPFLDEKRYLVVPDVPNSIKFEKLIFDALDQAKNPILMEVAREEEFSPVKNAQGKDSMVSCREDQLRQWVRWFKAAKVDIPCTNEGIPLFAIEISPLFADTEDVFVLKWNALSLKPEIVGEIYLE